MSQILLRDPGSRYSSEKWFHVNLTYFGFRVKKKRKSTRNQMFPFPID